MSPDLTPDWLDEAARGAQDLAGDARESAGAMLDEASRLAGEVVDWAGEVAQAVGGAFVDQKLDRYGPRVRTGTAVGQRALTLADSALGWLTRERLPLGVPGWMVVGAGPLPRVADELLAAAAAMGEVEGALTALLADTAGTLGWRGDAAEAAQVRQARQARSST